MRSSISFLLVIAVVFILSPQAYATLILRGEGTSVHGTYRLIYDSDLDITWYDYTILPDTWLSQVNWASALSVNFGGNVYTDWRLPTTVDGLYVYGTDGTTTGGLNIPSSEMEHLYYTELGNDGYYDTSGNPTGCNNSSPFCLTNTGDFQNLQPTGYWTGMEYTADTNDAWGINFRSGYQVKTSKVYTYHTLAVRNGDVTGRQCGDILALAVHSIVSPNGNCMTATFKPNFNLTLDEAALACGYDHFNWIQYVTYDDDPRRPTVNGNKPTISYIDPPLGGWDYPFPVDDFYIGYWHEYTELSAYTSSHELEYLDCPGVSQSPFHIEFKTTLAGVSSTYVSTAIGNYFIWESDSIGGRSLKNLDESLVIIPSNNLISIFPISRLPQEDINFLNSQGISTIIHDQFSDSDSEGELN
jgi:hypothetical protein